MLRELVQVVVVGDEAIDDIRVLKHASDRREVSENVLVRT